MDGPNRRALIERITPVQHEPIEYTPTQRLTPVQHTPTITPVQHASTGHFITISREPVTTIEHITPIEHSIITPIEHIPIEHITPVQPTPIERIPISREPLSIEHIPIEHIPTPVQYAPIEHIPIEHITPVQPTPIERIPISREPIAPVQHAPIQRTPITPIQRAPTGHAPIIEPPIGPPISRTPITPVQHTPIERIPISREPLPIEHITPVQPTPIQRLTPIASTVASALPPIQVTRVMEPVRASIIGIQAPTSFINALENISRERLGKPLPIEGGTPIAYLPWGGLTHIQGGIIIIPRRSILPSNVLSELRKEAEEKNALQHGISPAFIISHSRSPSAPLLMPNPPVIPKRVSVPIAAQLVNSGGSGIRLFLQDLKNLGVPLNYSDIVNYFVKLGVNLGEARNLTNKVEQYLIDEYNREVQASLAKLPPSPIPASPAGASSSPQSLTGFLNRLIHVTAMPLNNQYISTNAKLYTANINIDQVMKEVEQFLKQHPVLAVRVVPFTALINNQLMISEDALRSWLENYYRAYLTELNLPGAENVISFITSYYKNNPGMMQELIGGLTNAYAGALTLTGGPFSGPSPYILPLLFVPQLNNLYEGTVQEQIAQELNKELASYQAVLNNVVSETTSAMNEIPKQPPWPTMVYTPELIFGNYVTVLKGGGSNINPGINQAIKTAEGALSEVPSLTKLSQEVQKTINQALSAGMAIPSQLTPLSPNQLQAITSTLQNIIKAGTAYEELFGAPSYSPLSENQPPNYYSSIQFIPPPLYSYEYVGGLLGKYLTTPPGVALIQSLIPHFGLGGETASGLNLSLKIPSSVLLSAYSVSPALINAWSGISPIPKTHPYVTNPYAPAQLFFNPNSPLGQWINQENSLAANIDALLQQYATAIAQLTGQSQSILHFPTITLPTTIPIIVDVTTKTITKTINNTTNSSPNAGGATSIPINEYMAGLISALGTQSLYSSNPFLRGLAGAWRGFVDPIALIAAQLSPYWRGYLTGIAPYWGENLTGIAPRLTLFNYPTNEWEIEATNLAGENFYFFNPVAAVKPFFNPISNYISNYLNASLGLNIAALNNEFNASTTALSNYLNASLEPNIAALQQSANTSANTPPPSTGAMFPSSIPDTITPQDKYVAGLIAGGSHLAPGMQYLHSSNPLLRGLAGAWWDIYNYIAPITQIAAQYVLPPYWRGYLTGVTENTNAAFLAAQPTLAKIPTNRWGLTAASLLGMPTQGNEVIINPAGLVNPAIIIAGIAGSGLESLSKVGRLADIAPTLEAISNIRYIDPMTYVFEGGAAAAGGITRAVTPILSTISRNIGLGVGGLGAKLMKGAVTDLLNRMGYRVEAAEGEEEAQALLSSGAYRGANNLFLVPVKPIPPTLGRINIPMDLPTLTALYGELSDAYYRDLYRGLEMYFNTPPGELMSRGLSINAPLWDSLRLRLGSMLEWLGKRFVLPPFRGSAPFIRGVQVEETVPGEGIYFAQPITKGRMKVPIVPQGFFYYLPRGVVGAITNRGVIPLGLSIGGSAAPGITNRFIGISDVLEASPFNFRLTTQPYVTSQELGNLITRYWSELRSAYAAARSAAVRDALTDMGLSPLARLLAAASEYFLPKSLRPLLPETVEDWNKGLLAAAAARILEEFGGGITVGPGPIKEMIYRAMLFRPSPIEGMLYRAMELEPPPRAALLFPQDFLQQAIQRGLPRAVVKGVGINPGNPVIVSYDALSNTINEMMKEMRSLPSMNPLTSLPDTLISSIGLSGYAPLLIPRSGGSILDYGIISDLLGGRAIGYSVMGSPIIIRGGEAWPGGIPIKGATVLTGEYGAGIGEVGNAPTTPIEGAPSEGSGLKAISGEAGGSIPNVPNINEGTAEELLTRGEEGGVPLLARAPIQASEAAEEAEAALSVPRPTMNNAPATAQPATQRMNNAPAPAPTAQSSIDTITQLEPNMNDLNDIIKRYSINNIDKDIMNGLRDLEKLRMMWRTSLEPMQGPSTREWTWGLPRYPTPTKIRNNEEEESTTTTTSVQSSIQLPPTTSTTTIQYQSTGSREEMYWPPSFPLENPNQAKPEPPWWWGLNQEVKRKERGKERKAGKAREKLML